MPIYTLVPVLLAGVACLVALRAKGGLSLAGVAVFAAAVGPYAAQSWLAVTLPSMLLCFVIFDTLAIGGLLKALIAQHPRRLHCRSYLALGAAFMLASIAAHGLFAVHMLAPVPYVGAVIAFQMAASAILLGVAIGGHGHAGRAGTHRRGTLRGAGYSARAPHSEGS